MKPAVFETTATEAHAPAADAEQETAAVDESSVLAGAGSPPAAGVPPTEPSSSTIEPSSAAVDEGMFVCCSYIFNIDSKYYKITKNKQ